MFDTKDQQTQKTSVATFQVTRTGTSFDDSAPAIASFSVSPNPVDVGSSAVDTDVTLRLTDMTGIKNGYIDCAFSTWGSPTYRKAFLVYYTWSSRSIYSESGNDRLVSFTGTDNDATLKVKGHVPLGLLPGAFTCSVNAVDTLNHSITDRTYILNVLRTPAGMPAAPSGLAFSPTSGRPTDGTLTWDAPTSLGDPALYTYDVQYSTNGINWVTIPHSNTRATSISLTNLRTDTSYSFRVRGENGGNTLTGSAGSAWGEVLETRTYPSVVPSPPTELSVTSVTSTGFVLSWASSSYNGGETISNVSVELSRDGGVTWVSARGGISTSSTVTVAGTAPGTAYQVRIASINSVGASDYLAGSVTTTALAPGAPLSLASSSVAATSLTLGWDLPTSNGGAAITDYKVEFSSNAGSTWTVIAHDASAVRSFNVTGLLKGKSYQFRVSAINEIGTGASSAVHTVSTLTTVPGVPTSVVVSSVTSSTARLTWVAPVDNGGSAITDYTVQTSRDEGTTWATVTHTASTTAAMNLTGLAPGTRYIYRVATKTAAGSSDFVEGDLTTLTVAPGAPLNLASSSVTATALTLNWDLPTSNGGAAITDYKVEFSSNGGTSWTVIAHDASAVRSFNVTGLSKGRSYQFRVTAVNEVGAGATSAVHTVSTSTTVPAVPNSVAVSSVTASSASVSWTAPTDNGGSPITDYTFQTSRDEGTTWVTVTHTASTSTVMNLTGLAPGTHYLVRVATKTAVGSSDYVQSELTTNALAPGAPLSLASSSVAATSLTLNWELPTSNGGADITDYKVEFSSNGGSAWNLITHDASAVRSFNVTGLTRATAYRFRVTAKNSIGYGAVSAVLSVTTPFDVPGAPTALTKASITGSGITLGWTAPTNNGGAAVSDYKVEVSRDSGSTWSTVPRAVSTSRTLVVTGLAPGTEYQVRVSAKNSAGFSTPLTGSFTTLSTVPGTITNLATSNVLGTSLTLTWDLPASNGGSAISDYQIQVSSNGTTFTTITKSVSNIRTFNVTTGLAAGTKYWFRVAAINSLGTGAVSSAVNVVTVGNVPNAPTSLAIKPSTKSVALSWTAATVSSGSAIRNYLVEYSTNGGTSWTTVTKTVSTSTTLSVTGLRSKTAYLFRVSAVNDVGSSTPSANLAVTTR
jgi:titin